MPGLALMLAISTVVGRLTAGPVPEHLLWTSQGLASAVPAGEFGAGAVRAALALLGADYHHGGDGAACPSGAHEACADCSGLVCAAYAAMGLKLPHSTAALAAVGEPVPLADVQPGDILFFRGDGSPREPADHCGLYVGNGLFIHAGSRGVRLDDLQGSYWGSREPARLRAARRLAPPPSARPGPPLGP